MNTQHLNTEFESLRGSLKSFLLRITASVADAEDLVHDTYLKAAEKIDTFRAESALKTWIFTIARFL
jgi:RNA polymerase sigma-70 factor, ECF subfamily